MGSPCLAPISSAYATASAASRGSMPASSRSSAMGANACWLRTNGVDTNGAAAEVMHFDRLGKKVRPGTFGKIKQVSGSTRKVPLSKNMNFAVTPLVLTPFVPFRACSAPSAAAKQRFSGSWMRTSPAFKGKRLHTRNQHRRNRRGLSVAFPMEFQWHVPMGLHCSEVVSKGLSLSQRIFTGIVQWILSGVFQRLFTFVTSAEKREAPELN